MSYAKPIILHNKDLAEFFIIKLWKIFLILILRSLKLDFEI